MHDASDSGALPHHLAPFRRMFKCLGVIKLPSGKPHCGGGIILGDIGGDGTQVRPRSGG